MMTKQVESLKSQHRQSEIQQLRPGKHNSKLYQQIVPLILHIKLFCVREQGKCNTSVDRLLSTVATLGFVF